MISREPRPSPLLKTENATRPATARQVVSYTPVARWLHWIMAGLILTTMLLGFGVDDIEPAEGAPTLAWHASLGAVTLGFAILRFLWRLGHPPVGPDLGRRTIEIAHLALYGLMFLVPVSGILAALAQELPRLCWFVDPHRRGGFLGRSGFEMFGTLHSLFVYALQVLLLLHILGALMHQFYLRDHTLRSMRLWGDQK